MFWAYCGTACLSPRALAVVVHPRAEPAVVAEEEAARVDEQAPVAGLPEVQLLADGHEALDGAADGDAGALPDGDVGEHHGLEVQVGEALLVGPEHEARPAAEKVHARGSQESLQVCG